MAKGDVKVVLVGDANDLKKAFKESEDSAGSFDSKMGAVSVAAGMAIYNIAVKVGELALKAAEALPALGAEFDDAYDHIRVATGLTGAAFEGMQESLRNVAVQVPESIGDVGSALAILAQRLDLSGKPAEDLAKQFLDLSHITGDDLTATMKTATGAFNAFSVPADKIPAKLDELFRASQKSGLSVNDMASQMSQSGTVMQSLGFTFDDTTAIIANLGKYGLDTSSVMAGLKKELADSAKHGVPAKQAFHDLLAIIKTAPSDTAAAQYAMEKLGERAGPQFAALVRQGKFNYEDLEKAIAGGSDTIEQATSDTADWQESLGKLVNMVKVEVEPVANAVFGAITTAAEGVKGFVGGLIDAYKKDGLTGLVAKFKEDIGKLRDWFATSAWPTVYNGAVQFLRNVKDWVTSVGPEIAAKFVGWYHSFTDWVSGVWNGIEGDGVAQKLGTLYRQYSDWIRDRAPQLADKFKGWYHSATDWASSVWNGSEGSDGYSQKLAKVWKSVTGWVGDRAKDLADNWKGWVHSATVWLEDVWKEMPKKLDKVMKAIDDWCNDPKNLNDLLQKGSNLGLAVVKGVAVGIGFLALVAGPLIFSEMGKVLLSAGKAVAHMGNSLASTFFNAGVNMVKSIISGITSMTDAVSKAFGHVVPDWAKGIVAQPWFLGGIAGGHAIGGILPDGMSMVGEQGPELAMTQGGLTRIIPNSQSGAMLAAGGRYEDGSRPNMGAAELAALNFAKYVQRQEYMRAHQDQQFSAAWGTLAVNPFAQWAAGADFSNWGKPAAAPPKSVSRYDESRQSGTTETINLVLDGEVIASHIRRRELQIR